MHELSCHKCPEGSFTFTNGSSMCACLPGRRYLGNGHCELCPKNTYKSKIGFHNCLTCPEYSEAATGSVTIDNCTCEIDPDMTKSTLYRPVCPKPPDVVRPYNSSVKFVHKLVTTTRSFESDMTQGQVLGAIAAIVSCAILLVIVAIYIRRRRNRYLGVEMQSRVIKSFKMSSSDDSRFSDSITVLLSEQTTECDIRIKKIRLGRLIGRGAFGQVHEGFAYCDSTSDVRTLRVAVKRIKMNCSNDEKHALKQEYEQMRLLGHHSNIIGLIGTCMLTGQMAIILEYAELGDLLSYLKDKSSKLENYVSISPEGDIAEQEKPNITEEKELMVFAWQIARGMTYVHQQKCIHRDLAARNILIASGPVAKISDFGLSRDVYENGYYFRASKGQLPYKWLSPEALLWGQYSTKSDVWSFGILLWEITTLGGSPYPGIPVDQIAELHRSGYRLSQPPSCPNNFFQILKACWEEDPRKRPSFAKLCSTLDEVLQKVFVSDYLDMQPTSNSAYLTHGDSEGTALSLSGLADKGRMDSGGGNRDNHNSSGYSSSITSYS
ncbi:fibroblast growth factor receptor 4-like [Gigantopelta aegis]|uniref:fibroblast growth factor receptor 4-like n=1 Tax=Gigantopelta aegis TaxID=1735272 RepID=UPI001B88BCED|nr:fibroblast growth factor receptor 4-like [Gigantopelta aegis]